MSFSVSFIFHHHDVVAVLPDANNAHVGQKDGGDEPPYQIAASILMQGRDLSQAQGAITNMGSDVALVPSEVELDTRRNGRDIIHIRSQAIQCFYESRHGVQIGLLQA